MTKIEKALRVLVLSPLTRTWLSIYDPKALQQGLEALAGQDAVRADEETARALYLTAVGREMQVCPPDVIESLIRYRDERIPTGDFLAACLANDLRGALGRADANNRFHLFGIMTWIAHEMPVNAWGSRIAVRAWISGGREGE